jgi:branched-chain amino acid transport system permease protein
MIYLIHLLIYLDIFVIVALSLNIAVGYCGILTLAHGGFFAIGAYTYALSVRAIGWGLIPAGILAALIAACLSLILSLASWRMRGDFFVLFSLAVQTIIFGTIFNWWSPGAPIGSWQNLTNGSFGISGISKPQAFGLTFESVGAVALLFTTIACGFLLLSRALLLSPWGRVLKAMRDDELATRSLGKNVRLLKVQALALSCAIVAFAGAMYASYVSFVDPTSGSLAQSILFLSMIIVGGVGNSVRGPFVGALALLVIPEVLRFLALPDTTASEIRLLVYGLLLVLLTHFRPRGLAGDYKFE